jgi:predicted  nucleic acid-binding Zn-ribbon protein
MDFQEIIKSPFVWGLALGLLLAGFILKNAISSKLQLKREIKRIEGEMRDMQSHLNTQMKITATGNDTLTKQIEELKLQNENLRVNLAALQNKPDKAEQRQFRIQEMAVSAMREQAPGFAGAWEKAMRQAEAEMDSAESGFTKLMRKVVPGLGHSTSKVPVSEPHTLENTSETS